MRNLRAVAWRPSRPRVRAAAAGVAALAGLAALGHGGADGAPRPPDPRDPGQAGRFAAVGPQAPRIAPGWPVAGSAAPLLIAPAGAPVTSTGAPAREAVLWPAGRVRRLGPPGVVRAIGHDGRRYAFDGSGDRVIARDAAGRRLWVSPPVDLGPEASDRGIVPSPRGGVYVTGDRGVAAIDGRGRVAFIDGFGSANAGALAVRRDGVVVHGAEGGVPDHRVVARDHAGRVLWERAMPGRVNAVAIDAGRVVVAHDRADASGGAGLRALSAADGGGLWSLPTGLHPPGPPALAADGSAYVVVAGRLVSVDPAGAVAWTVRGPFVGAPLIGGDGTVYAGGAPAAAVRPDGTVAWRLPDRGLTRVEAIGRDGRLHLAREGGIRLALSAPGRPGAAYPGVLRRPLVAGLRVGHRAVRLRGAVSVCARGPAACRPRAPLGTTVSFRLSRPAAVALVVRRRGAHRPVAVRALHLPAGTTWRALADLLPRDLAPGPYAVTARAAAGRLRVVSGPVSFRIVGRARPGLRTSG